MQSDNDFQTNRAAAVWANLYSLGLKWNAPIILDQRFIWVCNLICRRWRSIDTSEARNDNIVSKHFVIHRWPRNSIPLTLRRHYYYCCCLTQMRYPSQETLVPAESPLRNIFCLFWLYITNLHTYLSKNVVCPFLHT